MSDASHFASLVADDALVDASIINRDASDGETVDAIVCFGVVLERLMYWTVVKEPLVAWLCGRVDLAPELRRHPFEDLLVLHWLHQLRGSLRRHWELCQRNVMIHVPPMCFDYCYYRNQCLTNIAKYLPSQGSVNPQMKKIPKPYKFVSVIGVGNKLCQNSRPGYK